MAADGKTPPTHPQGGGGNIMCTCSIFVCRHKNNDMSTLLGHAHTYIPTDRQSDTQAYIHKSIQTYSYTYTWLHMCDVSPLWVGGWGGTRGGWIIYIYIYFRQVLHTIFPPSNSQRNPVNSSSNTWLTESIAPYLWKFQRSLQSNVMIDDLYM